MEARGPVDRRAGEARLGRHRRDRGPQRRPSYYFIFALFLYVGHFANYNATYGSIAGVIVLMLWLYLSGIVLLVGAAINAEIASATSKRRGEPRTQARVRAAAE